MTISASLRHTTRAADLLGRDARFLWHPWSPTRVTPETIVAERGHGCEVVDVDGTVFLDAKSSGLNATLGYRCEPVIDAATAQLRTLMTYDLGEGASVPSALLAERIAEVAGPALTRTFFCSSGSEAVEAAIRIARFHHRAAGEPGRVLVASLDRAYHGATLGAAAATGGHADPLTPPGFVKLPAPRSDPATHEPAIRALRSLFETQGEQVAALLLEPVSARTALPLPHAYLVQAQALCRRFGALLVVDEVTTGFGRTGTMFAHTVSGITPDVMCTSKGLGAGYASIGAVTTTEAVFARFESTKSRADFVHGHTHSGHATACATALAVLRYLDDHDILANVVARATQFAGGIADAAARAQAVDSLHGRGLLWGLEMTTPGAAHAVREHLLRARILVRRTGRAVIFAPPLIIDSGQTDRVVAACRRALADLG